MPKYKRRHKGMTAEERRLIKYDEQAVLLRSKLGLDADPDFHELKPARRSLYRKQTPVQFARPVLFPYEILVPFGHVPVGRLVRFADGNGCEWTAVKDDLGRMVRAHNWAQGRIDEYHRVTPDFPVAVPLAKYRPVAGKPWTIYEAGSEWLEQQLAKHIVKLKDLKNYQPNKPKE